jgi:trehalose 6-phosphate synthase/phosphatase
MPEMPGIAWLINPERIKLAVGSQTERLLVVSNRLPATVRSVEGKHRIVASVGGLATALEPILEKKRGLWLGWPGDSLEGVDPVSRLALLDRLGERRLRPVELPRSLVKLFYEGYANQTLWPLFHHFPSRLVFDPAGWEAYVEANTLFMEAILSEAGKDDLIWVHDYQLMLLPQMIRSASPEARIGFFLHIPFPSSAVFRVLPRREELLQGLLGADFIAFQTHSHLQHFRSSLLRILGISSRMDQVLLGGRAIRLEALPIGIATGAFMQELSGNPVTKRCIQELHQRFRGRRLLLSVDRLDYTKGIPERLRSFRRLLQANPEFRGELTLIQVAVPSRERVPSYQQLRREVNELVGSINGEYGSTDWTPVVYIRRALQRPELTALYSYADVAWITPLRDGMNLVAKEYVACQTEGRGVLVLSEFAGAAAEMGEALLVNPYDEERMAACVAAAVRMPLDERRQRMGALRHRVLRNDAFAWSGRFVRGLKQASERRVVRHDRSPDAPDPDQIMVDFTAASVRWLFFDCEAAGLTGERKPGQAGSASRLLEQLAALASETGTCVALLSGGRKEDLTSWVRSAAGLWLVAEDGAFLRRPDSETWESLNPSASNSWKHRVRPVLEHLVDGSPGSVLEEKENALVWHYRLSEPEFGDWLANEVVSTLEQLLAETDLRAIRGPKSVEVRPIWASKKNAVTALSALWPQPDFCLAVSGGPAAEELLEVLPEETISISVGPSLCQARFRLLDTVSAHAFVAALSFAESQPEA